MKIFVNDKEVYILPGMNIRHAIVSANLYEDIKSGKKVYDEWDNEVGLDGATYENMKIYIK